MDAIRDRLPLRIAIPHGTRIAFPRAMRPRNPEACRCSYVVVIDSAREPLDDLRELAAYLSTVAVAGCDVVVVDGSPAADFAEHATSLRWVSRHVAAGARQRSFSGVIDPLRAGIDFSDCDKVIVASSQVRYDEEGIVRVCTLLDTHEVVEPQDYFEPLPWWSGIESGRMLVHRGVDPLPDHGVTFGLRKWAVRGLRTIDAAWSNGDDPVRRLASQGAEVLGASDVFVRRLPPTMGDWLHELPRQADDDFAMPVKSALFFALLPAAVVLAVLGGWRLAAGYAGAVACASMVLALRGRMGASAVFPLRACLAAPVWMLERSVSVYWALFRKLRSGSSDATRPVIAEGKTNARIASGG